MIEVNDVFLFILDNSSFLFVFIVYRSAALRRDYERR